MMKDTPRFGILAALPREMATLTKTWRKQELAFSSRKVTLAWSDHAVAASAGMGAESVTIALDAVTSLTPIRAVVSVGFAGALKPGLHPGTVLRPSLVIDTRTGERFATAEGDGSIAVTNSTVADAAEKQRLHRAYAADLVDMEAAPLARLCVARALPFYAFKAISDDVNFSLPDLQRFATPQGQFRTAAFALHVALRPRLWSRAAQLGAGAAKAEHALSATLERWLAELFPDLSRDHLS